MNISIDTSFLAHAVIPNQQTAEAQEAFAEVLDVEHLLFGASGVYVEFPSLLRRFVTTGRMSPAQAHELFASFVTADIVPVLPTPALQRRAWEIAVRLGQSDTFDAMGYAVAEAVEGEFWTSDRRFTNAARAAGLERVRFLP